MNIQPKVSVIIPVYNVENYLPKCLDSAIAQTLENIEVICVNDGSTDDSLKILRRYADLDSRITVLDKKNAGYGAAMNDGLRVAKGEYVAFLESDDCIEETAYERLSIFADRFGVDVIKGDYYYLETGINGDVLTRQSLTKERDRYETAFCPLEEPWSFYIPMMNWLGLFRRDFLVRNGIAHRESPGASHQDLGFWFQTLCCAQSMVLVPEAFYKYRQDNEGSSIHDDTKAHCKLEEYEGMLEFLNSRPSLKEKALAIYSHRKFGSCKFAYDHTELALKLPFLRQVSASYARDIASGNADFSRFSDPEICEINRIIKDPDDFYLHSLADIETESQLQIKAAHREIVKLKAALSSAKHRLDKDPLKSSSCSEDGCMLSVVIPVYNTQKYIKQCLDSVIRQPVSSMEIICIDDGSTDGSSDLLAWYAANDARVTVVRQENSGQGVARNRGLAMAKGKYIRFIDSDDFALDNSFDRLIEIMEADSLDVLLFDGGVALESGVSKKDEGVYRRDKPFGTCVSGDALFSSLCAAGQYRVQPCLALYRRAHLQLHRVRFPEYVIYEDNVFMAKALLTARRVSHINEMYYVRRYRPSSTMTSNKSSYNVISYFQVLKEMVRLSEDLDLSINASEGLAREVNSIMKEIRRIYANLTATQKEIASIYTPVDSLLFQAIVQGDYAGAMTEKQLLREIAKIHSSNSWRIGRAVTSFPRMLKRAAKKMKTAGGE